VLLRLGWLLTETVRAAIRWRKEARSTERTVQFRRSAVSIQTSTCTTRTKTGTRSSSLSEAATSRGRPLRARLTGREPEGGGVRSSPERAKDKVEAGMRGPALTSEGRKEMDGAELWAVSSRLLLQLLLPLMLLSRLSWLTGRVDGRRPLSFSSPGGLFQLKRGRPHRRTHCRRSGRSKGGGRRRVGWRRAAETSERRERG
jgi:hypothetical protein